MLRRKKINSIFENYVRMELGSVEEQPNKCQNHNCTKIKSGVGKQKFSIPFFRLNFWGRKN